MSGQFHMQAALPHGEEPAVNIAQIGRLPTEYQCLP